MIKDKFQQVEVASMLIERGADFTAQNKYERLHYGYLLRVLRLEMPARACLPVSTVSAAAPEPYKRISPRRSSIQYQKRRPSMSASESTKERMLGEKRCGTPGRTAPHYEHNPESIISIAKKPSHMKREKGHTYQYQEDGPWGDNERGEERRDGAWREFWIWVEGMRELGARKVQDFFGVHRRGRRRWDVKVKEVECRGSMHEGAEEEGDV